MRSNLFTPCHNHALHALVRLALVFAPNHTAAEKAVQETRWIAQCPSSERVAVAGGDSCLTPLIY